MLNCTVLHRARLSLHWSGWVFVRVAAALAVLTLCSVDAHSWGGAVHRFLTLRAVGHLPPVMQRMIQDSSFLALHSVDADNRRVGSDTSLYAEGPRHYLDIDDYPDFTRIPRDLDSLIGQFGWERVKQNGILPWAVVWTYDSLVVRLERNDWEQALLAASDLAHYVADAHQPLHATRNYNGQETGNTGIHSRYESTMLSTQYYFAELTVAPAQVFTVEDPLTFVFESLIHSQSRVAEILAADNAAKASSGWSGSGTAPASYYHALWFHTRELTLDQLQRASEALASLWYSAWVEAGLAPVSSAAQIRAGNPEGISVSVYPNPFNLATRIRYTLPSPSRIRLEVFDLLGRRIGVVREGVEEAGFREFEWQSDGPSGVYLCRLEANPLRQPSARFVDVTKLILAK